MSARSWVPVIFFLILLIHGSTLGLSDDEAYYWVLAQKPSLGYAFHPPAVAWWIAGVQSIGQFFGNLFGRLLGSSEFIGLNSVFLVRFPAVLLTAGVLLLSLNWLRQFLPSERDLRRASGILISFSGYFALSWMMVPDIFLYFSLTLLFVSVWQICFQKPSIQNFLALGIGSAGALLSKFSGVLGIFSAFVCLCFWTSGDTRRKGIGALLVGAGLGALPTVIWNAGHEWGSLLYQLRDRHGSGDVSWVRYGRFWVVQLLLAGPILVLFTLRLLIYPLRKSRIWEHSETLPRVWVYSAIWAIPAAGVFCFQPLFSDFKLHWAFVVWWPGALALAASLNERSWRWIRYQVLSGLTLGIFILVCCHIPLGGWLIQSLKGSGFDPRLDVTNDFYGWNQLRMRISSEPLEVKQLEVVGSRYQAASQAAFNLAGLSQVTFLPRDGKELDEWPDLKISEGQGPEWPQLKKSILFVADNRYDAPPEFPKASCRKIDRIVARRFNLISKWIDLWRCDPEAQTQVNSG